MAISTLYNKSFTVKAPTWSSDHGSTTRTLSSGTTFDGRIRVLGANEGKEYGKERVLSTHRLYCDTSNSITATSVIEDVDGNQYDVLGPINNPHELDKFYQIDLKLRI